MSATGRQNHCGDPHGDRLSPPRRRTSVTSPSLSCPITPRIPAALALLQLLTTHTRRPTPPIPSWGTSHSAPSYLPYHQGSIENAIAWLTEYPAGSEPAAGDAAPMDVEGGAGDDSKAMEGVTEGGAAEPLVAKSIKCVETGRIFKNMVDAQVYAERTGRSDFEESTEEVKVGCEQRAHCVCGVWCVCVCVCVV